MRIKGGQMDLISLEKELGFYVKINPDTFSGINLVEHAEQSEDNKTKGFFIQVHTIGSSYTSKLYPTKKDAESYASEIERKLSEI